MTETDVLEQLSDRHALALTAMGEARGDSAEGSSSVEERLACMMTIRNRLRTPQRFGDSFKAVCFKRSQYSCWNSSDPNRAYLISLAERLVTSRPSIPPNVRELVSALPLLDETLYFADGVISGVVLDHTDGATHYYSPRSMQPRGAVPFWAKGVRPCATIGGSLYFRGV